MPQAPPRFREVLGIPPFSRLFAAHAASLVGSEITSVGLALLAYELAGEEGATVVLGLALTLRIAAFVLVSPFAGTLADRLDRRAILVGADLVRVGMVASLSWVDRVWQVCLLIFLLNCVTACFTPTYKAVIPEVTGERLYVTALSLSRIAYDLAALGGPVAAAGLIWLGDFRLTFWVDAATFLISALLILWAGFPARPRETEPGTAWQDMLAGMRGLFGHPLLRYTLVLYAALAVAGAVLIVDSVLYAKQVLGLGDAAYGLLMGAVGLGSIAGALGAKQVQHRVPRQALLQGGVVLLGLALVPVLLRPGFAVTAALWFAAGAAQSLLSIPAGAYLAELTAPKLRGRVFAAHFAVTHLFWAATYPAAGFLAAGLGAPVAFSAAGALVLLLGLGALFSAGYRGRAA